MSETTETAGARRGVDTRQPDGRQRLEFHRSWPDPIEEVWSALTEPDRPRHSRDPDRPTLQPYVPDPDVPDEDPARTRALAARH